MAHYNRNFNGGNSSGDLASWLIIAAMYFIFWPVAVFLTLKKLGILQGSSSHVSEHQKKIERYMQIVQGCNAIKIEDIASAAGVSYETALRELQQMLSMGDFGTHAYINYMTKTLFLDLNTSTRSRSSSSAYRSYDYSYNSKSAADTGKKANYKNNDKTRELSGHTPTLMIVLSIILMACGLLAIASSLDILAASGLMAMLPKFIFGLFLCAGGGTALMIRSSILKRSARIKKYKILIKNKKIIPISDLAIAAGVNDKTVKRDLDTMIDKGMLGNSAYIDLGNEMLVLSPDAKPQQSPESEDSNASKSKYDEILSEIRKLNEEIKDNEVSERIYKIENVTAKIFKAVEEKPEKLPQIKSFMSYYLPTTLKLLRSYSMFENQGVSGSNIDSAKKDIERILDTLVKGFNQQLDQLFKSDVIDISSDIGVLETMMKKDGLSDDGSTFKTMSGH